MSVAMLQGSSDFKVVNVLACCPVVNEGSTRRNLEYNEKTIAYFTTATPKTFVPAIVLTIPVVGPSFLIT
jgi:hypothetical protein